MSDSRAYHDILALFLYSGHKWRPSLFMSVFGSNQHEGVAMRAHPGSALKLLAPNTQNGDRGDIIVTPPTTYMVCPTTIVYQNDQTVVLNEC